MNYPMEYDKNTDFHPFCSFRYKEPVAFEYFRETMAKFFYTFPSDAPKSLNNTIFASRLKDDCWTSFLGRSHMRQLEDGVVKQEKFNCKDQLKQALHADFAMLDCDAIAKAVDATWEYY